MSEVVGTTGRPPGGGAANRAGPIRGFMQATEIDARMLGMVLALAIVWIGFHIVSGGVFLTPRNLWNLSVQTSTVAIMATGMVLVIVSRNIDLSVGSLLGLLAMIMGALQTEILPSFVGYDYSFTWIIVLAAGLLLGALIGAVQGFVIAFLGVPAFIVTLGGLLVWRGAAWWVASGRTLAPLDSTFQMMGGGGNGSIGATMSWILGAIACFGIIFAIISSRRQRQRFDFPLRPVWAEVTLAIIGCAAVLGAVAVINAYPMPVGLARAYAAAHGIPWPEGGLSISLGIPIPVLIALGVALVVTFVATRTRFGRYVFAFGGNPEAAELGGINTRWIIMKVFILMGVLCGISAAVASARLNAATNSLGTNDELYVIAATVIGGTSFSGGIGTVPGAILGALVMQSLQSGMQLMGIASPLQNIVVGLVLVLAVGIDTAYRRRTA
ncbi:MAG: sugar ABC transporter permease [Bauldia sp.]|nr:sugar ABC transporter permease [Bauldia sp.]